MRGKRQRRLAVDGGEERVDGFVGERRFVGVRRDWRQQIGRLQGAVAVAVAVGARRIALAQPQQQNGEIEAEADDDGVAAVVQGGVGRAVAGHEERSRAGDRVRRRAGQRQRRVAQARRGGAGRQPAWLHDDDDAAGAGRTRGVERDEQAAVRGGRLSARQHHRRRQAGGDEQLCPCGRARTLLDGDVAVGGGRVLRQRRLPEAAGVVQPLPRGGERAMRAGELQPAAHGDRSRQEREQQEQQPLPLHGPCRSTNA